MRDALGRKSARCHARSSRLATRAASCAPALRLQGLHQPGERPAVLGVPPQVLPVDGFSLRGPARPRAAPRRARAAAGSATRPAPCRRAPSSSRTARSRCAMAAVVVACAPRPSRRRAPPARLRARPASCSARRAARRASGSASSAAERRSAHASASSSWPFADEARGPERSARRPVGTALPGRRRRLAQHLVPAAEPRERVVRDQPESPRACGMSASIVVGDLRRHLARRLNAPARPRRPSSRPTRGSARCAGSRPSGTDPAPGTA